MQYKFKTMKTEIHIQLRTKVQFIDSLKARITLINGDTYIVGFPSPYNHLQGDHFFCLVLSLIFIGGINSGKQYKNY